MANNNDSLLEQALKALKQDGWKIVTEDKTKFYLAWHGHGLGSRDPLSAREIIRLWRGFATHGNSSANKTVKAFSKGKDRTASRDMLNTERYDDIPSGKRIATEDIWAWD